MALRVGPVGPVQEAGLGKAAGLGEVERRSVSREAGLRAGTKTAAPAGWRWLRRLGARFVEGATPRGPRSRSLSAQVSGSPLSRVCGRLVPIPGSPGSLDGRARTGVVSNPSVESTRLRGWHLRVPPPHGGGAGVLTLKKTHFGWRLATNSELARTRGIRLSN